MEKNIDSLLHVQKGLNIDEEILYVVNCSEFLEGKKKRITYDVIYAAPLKAMLIDAFIDDERIINIDGKLRIRYTNVFKFFKTIIDKNSINFFETFMSIHASNKYVEFSLIGKEVSQRLFMLSYVSLAINKFVKLYHDESRKRYCLIMTMLGAGKLEHIYSNSFLDALDKTNIADSVDFSVESLEADYNVSKSLMSLLYDLFSGQKPEVEEDSEIENEIEWLVYLSKFPGIKDEYFFSQPVLIEDVKNVLEFTSVEAMWEYFENNVDTICKKYNNVSIFSKGNYYIIKDGEKLYFKRNSLVFKNELTEYVVGKFNERILEANKKRE